MQAAQCLVELASPAEQFLNSEAQQQREFAAEQRSDALREVSQREASLSHQQMGETVRKQNPHPPTAMPDPLQYLRSVPWRSCKLVVCADIGWQSAESHSC